MEEITIDEMINFIKSSNVYSTGSRNYRILKKIAEILEGAKNAQKQITDGYDRFYR